MNLSYSIDLNNLRFYAYHGCLPFEREEGGWYSVDVHFKIGDSDIGLTDNLEDTINYGEIYSLVEREMAVPANLIEHVARRIATGIVERFPSITKCKVTVTKENPPFEGEKRDYMGASASVTVEYE